MLHLNLDEGIPLNHHVPLSLAYLHQNQFQFNQNRLKHKNRLHLKNPVLKKSLKRIMPS
jgi:hypothetical protein